ncbi:MAG: methyl-accepting chemotaxis protein [Cocleimonas sp.]|nr:methyl-accepting chemotaxis protein [Cocleimonas sp.]
MPQNSDLNKDYVKDLELELRTFEQKSEGSDKTMRLIVYPAIFAFIVLASYGFYLIQSLASDVNNMAGTMEKMANSVDRNMESISDTMKDMNGDVSNLTSTIRGMSGDIGDMSRNTKTMVNSLGGMKAATYDMAASTNNMQRDMWSLNQNISTPLSMMNKFLPWKNNSAGPFPGSIAPLPPSYYPAPKQNLPIQQMLPLPVLPAIPALKGSNGQSSLGTLPNNGV